MSKELKFHLIYIVLFLMSKESKVHLIYIVDPNKKYSNYIKIWLKALNYFELQ